MVTELKMNTNIRRAVALILDDEVDVNPIIDLDNIRYLIDLTTWYQYGAIIWTRFDLTTQLPLDEVSYTRRYAAHNIFGEVILGPNYGTIKLQTSTFPSFPVPDDNGTVTP